MLAPTKSVSQEYKILVVKMANDDLGNAIAKKNYELLCDCDTILGLTYVLPMMKAMESLSKMASDKDTFVCDLVSFIILCIGEWFLVCKPAKKVWPPTIPDFQ